MMPYLTKVIDEVAADDAVFTCDVGEIKVWAARYLRFNRRRRLLGSMLHGSMANALPQAIGAEGSSPGRQSHFHVRRRWFHHADGRSSFTAAARAPSEDSSLQQWSAWFRRRGDEGGWLPQCPH